jgi:PH domain
VRKCGFIEKEGQIFKTWKNRYFVLSNGVFTYYVSPSSTSPYGNNQRGEVSSLGGKSLKVDGVMLSVVGGSCRDINLKIPSASERDEWIDALRQHIAYKTRLEAQGQR